MTTTETTDLARRLDTLEQIEAIKALKHRYWRACDRKDPEGFRDCFLRSGARIDYGRLGAFDDAGPMAEIFRKVALHQVDGKYVIFDMHHGLHPDITVTGPESASGRWTLKFRQINLMDRTERIATGEYYDEYRVEDGRWKMSVCRFVETWAFVRPLPEGAVVDPGTFGAAN